MTNFPANDIYAFNQFLQAAQSGHVESALHLVLYYLDGITNILPSVKEWKYTIFIILLKYKIFCMRVKRDAEIWSQFIINSCDPNISEILKLGIRCR